VIPPLGEPVHAGHFVVSAWGYRAPDLAPANDEAAERALAQLHLSVADTQEALPALADRFADVRALLDDSTSTRAQDPPT
jgi:hypothetical protein